MSRPGPPPHHRPEGGFHNPWPDVERHGLVAALRWMLVDRMVRPRAKDPDRRSFARATPAIVRPHVAGDTLAITWVGHSSVLLQLPGANVLTDPMWSERASPVGFAGPRRWVPAAMTLDRLPPLDVVLLSHDHYDHLDAPSVHAIARRFPEARWLAPLGVGALLRRLGARRVEELDWWDEIGIGALRVACTPAQHFSGRGLGDRDRTLWCGWTIATSRRRVFFAGDTGYHPEFGAIARRFGPFDAALLPIGAYEPRWFMRPVHMNPEEAVRAFADLVAEHPRAPRAALVPIHWGTFKLTDEAMNEPPERLRDAWRRAGFDETGFWLLSHGETRTLAGR